MIYLLRLIHVVAGVFWVGSALFATAFLVPAVRASGPAGGAVMQQIAQARKYPAYAMGSALLVLLSGLGLYSIASGGFSNGWMRSGSGITFGLGAVFAIAGGVLGGAVISPAAKRVGMLAAEIQSAGRPPSAEQVAEMQRLQGRVGKASLLVSVLLVLATAAMSVGRYVP